MAPCSAYTVHRAGPGLPRFVVITTTPFAASVPYSAVADGPFTTSIDSISSELRSFTRLGGAHPTPQTLDERFALTMRTPSTTYTGSLLSDRLLVPRIRTRDGLPVWLPGSTWTPAACALRRSVNDDVALCSVSFAASIVAMEFPCSRFVWSPVTVVTIASSENGVSASAKSAVAVSPARTDTAWLTAP